MSWQHGWIDPDGIDIFPGFAICCGWLSHRFCFSAGSPSGGCFKSVRPKDGFGLRSFPAMDRYLLHFSQVTGWIPPPRRRVGNCGRFGSVISSAPSPVCLRCAFCVIPISKRRSNSPTRAGPASLSLVFFAKSGNFWSSYRWIGVFWAAAAVLLTITPYPSILYGVFAALTCVVIAKGDRSFLDE